MKKRATKIQQTGLITSILLLSTGMCFSTGFASWVSIGGGSAYIFGNIDADDVYQKIHTAQVIQITYKSNLNYYAGSGFLNKDVFESSTTLYGRCSFDDSEAAESISSYSSSAFSLKITFQLFKMIDDSSESLNPASFSSIGFAVESISIYSNNFDVETQSSDPYDGTVKKCISDSSSGENVTFNSVRCVNKTDFNFDYSISISYDDDNDPSNDIELSGFPNLDSYLFLLSFEPGEAINE